MALDFPISGFASTCQNYIQSKNIASNFYKKSALAAILGALTLGNQSKGSLDLGRPGVGEILSGAVIPEIEKLQLGTINGYVPRIQGFKTQNTRELDVYDELPGTQNRQTRSHSQADQYGAEFKWGEIVTEITIQHEDKMRWLKSGTRDGAGLAAMHGLQHATEVGMQDHVDALIEGLWSGSPASQSASLWKSANANPFTSPGFCLGVLQMTSATNTYGRIDRTNADNAALWASYVDSTITSDNVQGIIDDFKYTKGLSDTGDGPYLMLCPNNQFVKFKAQAKASHTVIEQMPEGLIKMAKMGVTSDVVRVDDFYIVREPWLTTNGYTTTVVILDASTLRIMFHPERNMSVGPFKDQTEYGDNPADVDRAFIRSRVIFSNDNARRSARYTAIAA